MKKVNYNKEVRKCINNLNNNLIKNVGISLISDDVIIENDNLYNESNKMDRVFSTIFKMTAYSDLYSKLALMQKCNKLSDEEFEIFELLKCVSSFDELLDLFKSSPILFSMAIKSMLEFYNSSFYHKILRIKNLNEKDINNIKRINTIFDSDLENYDIDIDADYISKKILKNLGPKHSFDELITDVTIFLHSLLLVDKNSAEKIVLQLIKNNILLINYMQELDEFNPEFDLKDSLEYDEENLKNIKNLLYKNNLDKISFDMIYNLLYNNLIYFQSSYDVNNVELSYENEELLEKIMKFELKDN